MPVTNSISLKKLGVGFALAGALLLAVFAYQDRSANQGPNGLSPIAGLGGPFRLQNQRGERLSEQAFIGKPTLYFFGFTHCPDVCPTTLYELSEHLKELGDAANRLNVVFITVDPARDTPKALAEYMSAFDPRIVALTGTEAEMGAAIKAFRLYVKKVPLERGNYTVDHTASVFAADRHGRIVMIIGSDEAPEMVRTKLKRLIEMK